MHERIKICCMCEEKSVYINKILISYYTYYSLLIIIIKLRKFCYLLMLDRVFKIWERVRETPNCQQEMLSCDNHQHGHMTPERAVRTDVDEGTERASKAPSSQKMCL